MKSNVDNEIYHQLGDRWYNAQNDPIALLRAEAKLLVPWVHERLMQTFLSENTKNLKLLDMGCGAGFFCNQLANYGYDVTGIDISKNSIEIAEKYAPQGPNRPNYICADINNVPFPDQQFDVILIMDVLEHVDDWKQTLREAKRLLKPEGQLYFHTFNRNFLSYLVIIKLVEWFIPNTPKNMHVLKYFITPQEIALFLKELGFEKTFFLGTKPVIRWKDVFSILFKRLIPKDFSFGMCSSTTLAYVGQSCQAKPSLKSR